ncbi:MAG: DUF11 domain-containing protein, partial [Calditrichaeota bacterium]|nr:DUF11 domain-containing protein [Calditrichota bacterium]
ETNPVPTDDSDTDEEDDPTKTVVPSFDGKTDLLKTDFFVDTNSDGKIDAGDSIRYTITVKNSGQGTAHNVVFTDSIPNYTQYVQGSAVTSKGSIAATSPILRVEIGSVAPNESETVTISFTVLVTESITMVENQGYLDSDETNPVPTDDSDTDEEDDPTKTVVPSFDGKTDLLKTDFFVDTNSDGKIDAGDSIRYTITVKNSGQGTAHNVVFTDSIPNYTQYVQGSAVTSKGTITATSPVLRVEIGSVAPNESETVTISFTVLVTESITMVENQGYLDSDETRPVPTDDPDSSPEDDSTVTKRSSFSSSDDVFKSDSFFDTDASGTITAGDTIKYQITIKNSGGAAAFHVVFRDTIPNNTSLIKNSIATTKGSVTSTAPVLTVEIDSIAAFSAETVTIRFSVLVTQAASEISNQGFVYADDLPQEPTDDPETEIPNDPTKTTAPSLYGKTDLTKDAVISDVDGNKLLSAGDIITYTIKIKNSGKGTVHQVAFQDTIPEHTTYVEGSAQTSKGAIFSTSPVLLVNIGDIAPGNKETVTISFQVKLTETVQQVSNQGFIDSDETKPIPTDDPGTDDEDDKTIIDNSKFFTDIKLLQSVHTDSFFVQNGDTINFANEGGKYSVTINLTNVGGQDASSISLKAWFPDSLSISGIQPTAFSQTNDTLTWKFAGLAADSSVDIRYKAQIPTIMPSGQNLLIHTASATCVNENPAKLANNVAVDTVYNFGKEIPSPEIQATPTILDVNDSVTVSVNIPNDKTSWDLWIYLPDGQVVKNFADDFIATNNIERDAWVEIPVKYSQTHLLTTEKQEQVIFEVHATEIRGIEKTAQAGVTFRSSNYLVLDKNVFRPDIDGTLGIKFKLSYRRLARLDIYDLAGTHITRVAEDIFGGGWNTYYWNGITESGKKVGSGVYLVTLRTDEFKGWKKVIIVR